MYQLLRISSLCCLLFSATAFGKCYVFGSSIQLIHSSGGTELLQSSSFWGLGGNLGTFHLFEDDVLRIQESFDCPVSVTILKDGEPFTAVQYEFEFSVLFDLDGSYMVLPESIDVPEFSFILDHEQPSMLETVIQMSVLLSGAMGDDNKMRDDLRIIGVLPTMEPYSAMGFPPTDQSSSEVSASVLANEDPNTAIVDWVLIELRTSVNPVEVIYSKCGLLTRIGQVRSSESATFTVTVLPGSYYISVRHRNHLGVMSISPIGLYGFGRTLDFRYDNPAWGSSAQNTIGNYKCMWAGNVNNGAGPQLVKYIGANDDRDPILLRVGGSAPTNMVSGYYNEDLNLDGVVKYTGANNDRDVILQTIGGSMPTAVRVEQVP